MDGFVLLQLYKKGILGTGIVNVDMSEWLRRQTWNLLGFARAGSNPAVDAIFLFRHL